MHYPEQRYLSNLTVIRRECTLPEEATGMVTVQEGKRVDVPDVVAQGVKPSRHLIIDGAAYFGLRRRSELEKLMLVRPGEAVDEVQAIAGRSADRGKRLFSPVRGIVLQIADGNIILQELPKIIDLEAGVRGRVTQVIPGRGVVVEATGAQVQGVWGNDKRSTAILRLEPETGFENIYQDQLDMKYLGAVVVMRRPLKSLTLDIMEEQGVAGIIAPSMDYRLVENALDANGPVMLTEGFGSTRMSRAVNTLLSALEGQQVTLDAYLPRSWEARRPELIANIAGRTENPARPNIQMTLRPGMNVRVTREPYTGQIGRVIDLPKTPVLIDNGLRVPCAQVELAGAARFIYRWRT